ncbi:hypothetical protein Val02_82790 [Virgisporangium aliadipatigenens]|uniref:Uncharacterized protein n=1 Tax=Virgisporangium aliadipatigenens TaxID=741659 RepID=A0A8J3YVP6_9ACTN|nr:hypothetical protein Val02_82790 [Virgisporangium aliadipatigenens]
MREWNSRNELEQDLPSGGEWDPLWIPLSSGWGGSNLVVDHTPGRNCGAVFLATLDAGIRPLSIEPVTVRGLSDLIGAIVLSLQGGNVSFGSYVPRPVSGHIDWITETGRRIGRPTFGDSVGGR